MARRVLWLLALVAAPVLAAQPPHPFSVHDMVMMDRISDPQASPDGTRVVFVVRTTDLEANRGRTDLWLVSAEGGEPTRLTTHEANDTNPRWAPDGRTIWFLSERSGSSQVWRIPADGGEGRQITDLPLDVANLVVSPDGSRLAFTLDVFPECERPECTRERLDDIEAGKSSGRVYEHLFVRHWDAWKDGRRSHLFTIPAAGGDVVDVMARMDADTPSRPFGGPEEISFTPDGRSLVFTARHESRQEAWSTNFDLFLSPVDGSAPPRNLTAANPAWDTTPAFSQDGKLVAWLAMARPGYESDRFRILVRSWPDGEPRVLTERWDRSPQSLLWSPDGRFLYAVAEDHGQRALFAVEVASGRVRTVVGEGTVRSPALAGDRIIYGLDHLRSPVDLWSVRSDGTGARRLTHLNAENMASVLMGEPDRFTFAGWNGEPVEAFVVKPVGFDPSRRYPVAYLVHGGPQGSFGNDFHYRWNPQAYAGAGYAAVLVNFHGSTGYGQAFTDSIRGDWGGKPLVDLQKGLAAALERYPWMDGARVCALGASFGGYMVNWIEGAWPDRFRCLVSHDGNLDERMAYYDTEELWFPEWDHEGTPWENPEGYSRHNPIEQVGKWKTPMLVIHGARDYRVVDSQGLSVFTALQRRGIPSKLLYFPDENHWVLKPLNSIQWHDTVIDWLDRWVK